MARIRSIILVVAGLAVIAASVLLWFSALSAPGRSAVSPDIDPLSARLAFLAGLGWSLIGLGIGSRYSASIRLFLTLVIVVTGALLGGLMGFLAWFVIHYSLTS